MTDQVPFVNLCILPAMNHIFNKRLGMCFSHALPWLQDESMGQCHPLHVFVCQIMCICVFSLMLLAFSSFFCVCVPDQVHNPALTKKHSHYM